MANNNVKNNPQQPNNALISNGQLALEKEGRKFLEKGGGRQEGRTSHSLLTLPPGMVWLFGEREISLYSACQSEAVGYDSEKASCV